MAKTDKELALDLTSIFINSWNGNSKTTPINLEDVVSAFNSIYKAIHEKEDYK